MRSSVNKTCSSLRSDLFLHRFSNGGCITWQHRSSHLPQTPPEPSSYLSLDIVHVCSSLRPETVPLSVSLSFFLFVFSSFCCLCTNTSACLPGSLQVWGLYLITTRLNSLRQWRLIWRGGPGLSLCLPDSLPNTITRLFRYPAVCYNFAIFHCQGRAFWRLFIEFPAGPCCRGHSFLFSQASQLSRGILSPPHIFSSVIQCFSVSPWWQVKPVT